MKVSSAAHSVASNVVDRSHGLRGSASPVLLVGMLTLGLVIGFLAGQSRWIASHDVEDRRPETADRGPVVPLSSGSKSSVPVIAEPAQVRVPVAADALSDSPSSNATSVTVAEVIELMGPDWVTRGQEPGLERVTATGEQLGGQPHGEWEVIWSQRGWTEVGNYVFGARHGSWKLYDEDGELLRVSTYFGGRLDGPLRDRDGPNAPWREYDYVNGELAQ